MRFPGTSGALVAAAALAAASLPVLAGPGEVFLGAGIRERLAAGERVRVVVSRSVDEREMAPPPGLEVVRSLSGGRVLAGWLTPGGLDRLAGDRATRAVVIDRVVHPAGQVATAHVGVDRLQASGLTGVGRTIAIVDTGVDASHPDLGGTETGNPRIAGGWNFADGDGDLSDCDGHGTAVAGVAAGAQGVAPGASIVALKVFGARSGCRASLASDVLAAVDWAIERREELGIEVLNLSLADESERPGFCDSEDPVAAGLFARARAAGIAVVAASGNAGRSDGLSWPACHSDVLSVGMVYSASQGPMSWAGEAACTDSLTGPDVVPCASNTGPALSILAPGVSWSVPAAGGGRRTTFSGTSAAAPAAAGALLLERQSRPIRDPALLVDLLRTTGVPVADGRTGSSAPRVDAGAAFSSATPVTGPCDAGTDAGAVAEAVTCRAVVASLVGQVSSLAVALTLEHPAPGSVRATLTGPDGTSVRLLARAPRAGTVLREVFGRTVASEEPLSLLAGRPAAGTWTLRVEDDLGLVRQAIRSWALQIEPDAPGTVAAPGAPARLLPTAVRSAGLFGSFFSTDVVLFNPNALEAADVRLTFLPAGSAGGAAPSVALRIPPLATRTIEDVVGNVFRTTGYGPVHVESPPDVVAAGRTVSTSARGGAYGLFSEAVDSGRAIGAGEASAWLVPVFRPGSARVNLGFAEVAGGEAQVEVLVRDAGGSVKGSVRLDLGPLGSRQVNDAHGTASAVAGAGDLFEVRVLSGTGRVVSWATAVDNGSNDGLLVLASKLRRRVDIPASAHAPGLYGSWFRTDLKVSNPSPSPVNVKISFFPLEGREPPSLVLSFGAWETRVFEDVLSSLLGLAGDSAGAIRLTVYGMTPGVVASSRTFTEGPGGSYGLAAGPIEDSEARPGERVALTFLTTSAQERTNVGFFETLGAETLVLVTLLDSDGRSVATRDLFLDRNQAVQWSDVFAGMGVPPLENASALVEVVYGGAVAAHAIRIDNRSNDASFLPGRVVRSPRPAAP